MTPELAGHYMAMAREHGADQCHIEVDGSKLIFTLSPKAPEVSREDQEKEEARRQFAHVGGEPPPDLRKLRGIG